jgi:hypothetical protein
MTEQTLKPLLLVNVRKIQQRFETLLGHYLLFSNKSSLSISISLKGKADSDNKIELSLNCSISESSASEVSYSYFFERENNRLSFVSFYLLIMEKHSHLVNKYKPNYIEKYILPELFEKVKSCPEIEEHYTDFLTYEKSYKNNGFQNCEQSLLREINDLGMTLLEGVSSQKLKNTESTLLITDKNKKFIQKYLEGKFRGAQVYKDSIKSALFSRMMDAIENEINYENPHQIFEIFYKRIVCEDLAQHKAIEIKTLNTKSIPDMFRFTSFIDIYCYATEITPSGLMVESFDHIEINLSIGEAFDKLYPKDSSERALYKNQIKEFFEEAKRNGSIHLPYALGGKTQKNYKNLTRSEKKALYDNHFASSSYRLNAYKKFIEIYFLKNKKDQTKNERAFRETLNDTFNNSFPLIYNIGDVYGLIACEVYQKETKIHPRVALYNSLSRGKHNNYLWIPDLKARELTNIGVLVKQINKIKEKIFDPLFNYYPYHPFFLTSESNYVRLYIHSVLYKNEYKFETLEEAVDYFTSFRIASGGDVGAEILSALYSKMLETYLDSTFNIAKQRVEKVVKVVAQNLNLKIADAIIHNLYLLVGGYIELFLYFLTEINNHYPDYISEYEIEKYFNQYMDATENKSFSIGNDVSDNLSYLNYMKKVYVEGQIENVVDFGSYQSHHRFSLSHGFYLLFIYHQSANYVEIINLSCVSFPKQSKEKVKEIVDHSFESKHKVIFSIAKNNLMNTIYIKDVSEHQFTEEMGLKFRRKIWSALYKIYKSEYFLF